MVKLSRSDSLNAALLAIRISCMRLSELDQCVQTRSRLSVLFCTHALTKCQPEFLPSGTLAHTQQGRYSVHPCVNTAGCVQTARRQLIGCEGKQTILANMLKSESD